jgi:hypothetical protein
LLDDARESLIGFAEVGEGAPGCAQGAQGARGAQGAQTLSVRGVPRIGFKMQNATRGLNVALPP